ncbi:MAG: alkaline phosphatase family protein [Actinomycetota bacterium]
MRIRGAGLVVSLGFLLLVAAYAPGISAQTGPAAGVSEACGLPRELLVRTARGYFPGRSGQLQTLPAPPDFVGPGLPHIGPWDYLQQVPLFWYGPEHIKAQRSIGNAATSADIAPTEAELLDFDRFKADGRPLDEALVPGRREPPRLVVTIVWDAGGMNVLDEWPKSWPYLRSLIPKGTWYERATIGTTPSTTAPVHATIGTGDYPRSHGITSHRMRLGNRLVAPWETASSLLVSPTLADLYDRSVDNAAKIGTVATREIHLGMMGHGSRWGGGDKDLAVLRAARNSITLGAEGTAWNLTGRVSKEFKFPSYANKGGRFLADVNRTDRADGKADGRWRDHPMANLLNGFESPARVPFQTRLVERIIRKEGFGEDAVPDMMFINYKLIDFVSHAWSMNSLEMKDAVRAQDEDLKRFVSFLDKNVGEGKWVIVLTADHGSVPAPETTGATVISPLKLAGTINREFSEGGTTLVKHIQGTQMILDEVRLRQLGLPVEAVAGFVRTLTNGDLYSGTPPSFAEARTPAFEATFDSSVLDRAPCLRRDGNP